ncbi:MAG: hypothetical protein LBU48_02175, partial [Coriobacteriales bacterium]|nr:hypothetical protein [Coriobacteriales bacterium]
MNLVGYSKAFEPLPATAEALAQPEVSRYAFYLGVIVCGICFFLFHKKITRFKIYLDPVFALLMCLGTASFGIAYQQTLFSASVLATSGCILSGIGYNWFVCSVYLYLAQKASIKIAISSIAASLIFETLAATLCTLLLPKSLQIL